MQKLLCIYCNSTNTKRIGKRKNKNQTIQRYKCKKCSKTFTDLASKNKTYPIKTILNTLSCYNLGNSQSKTSKIISQKYKIKLPQKTISNWINEYKQILPFYRIRPEAIKLYPPEEVIELHTLMHSNLPYKFQLHRAKLQLLFNDPKYNNRFSSIKKLQQPITQYLEKVPTSKFPHHIFKHNKNIDKNKIKEQRASQLKLRTLNFTKFTKNNLANKLASLAINLAKTNKERHQAIQNFFLINDSTTIATEIPVYLTNDDIKYFQKRKFNLDFKNYETPITGHIDILQVRNDLIHILDYKPKANKINPTEQLTIYALALASRTKLALSDFKAAWFDENNYYEFFPLHAVYEKQKNNKLFKSRHLIISR